jgi:hypothetical protein
LLSVPERVDVFVGEVVVLAVGLLRGCAHHDAGVQILIQLLS